MMFSITLKKANKEIHSSYGPSSDEMRTTYDIDVQTGYILLLEEVNVNSNRIQSEVESLEEALLKIKMFKLEYDVDMITPSLPERLILQDKDLKKGQKRIEFEINEEEYNSLKEIKYLYLHEGVEGAYLEAANTLEISIRNSRSGIQVGDVYPFELEELPTPALGFLSSHPDSFGISEWDLRYMPV